MDSSQNKARVHDPQHLVLGPSQRLNRRLSPIKIDKDLQTVQPKLKPLLQSNDLLPRARSQQDSPLLRPGLVATTSAASRSSTLLTSPLDEVPERLWNRVLRTSSATEITNPYLSIDDITSTRLSLDEHAILSSPLDSPSRFGTSRRVNSMQKAFGDGFKSLRRKIKGFPSSIFPNASSGPPALLATDFIQQRSYSPAPHPPETCMSGALFPEHEEKEIPGLILDSGNGRSEPEVNQAESSKICSTMEREALTENPIASGTLEPSSARPLPPLPCPSDRQLSFLNSVPPTATQTHPVERGSLLNRSQSVTASARQKPNRYAAVEGAEDFRTRPPFNQHWRTRSFAADVPYKPIRPLGPYPRPPSRPNTACSSSRTLYRHVQDPRREVLYMDCSDCNPDFIWKNGQLCRRPSFSSAVPRSPRRLTFPGRGDNHHLRPITRCPKIFAGRGDLPGCMKIALYYPDSLERKAAQGLVTATPSFAVPPRDLVPASTPPANPRSYEIPISDYSRASIDGQASLRSWLEKEELMDDPLILGDDVAGQSNVDERRISRAFSARSLFRRNTKSEKKRV
ncbi:uncharacterized protein A1O9_07011 [Exophiala aquamarina CBS 119918]|uniref:Uncharacterized protein n=1 Tax=Exophiala aquamarina CBS 119918 TaxID=1182545 RepID=A0A072PAF4_9EURO|nr:uncharacterized protein A1O9_07011 [Exophiala aquamarina CBS 119918]KEF56821.1 hypothetical protein A1O9_07011 [Exophiala aquamarina CBS 119918]